MSKVDPNKNPTAQAYANNDARALVYNSVFQLKDVLLKHCSQISTLPSEASRIGIVQSINQEIGDLQTMMRGLTPYLQNDFSQSNGLDAACNSLLHALCAVGKALRDAQKSLEASNPTLSATLPNKEIIDMARNIVTHVPAMVHHKNNAGHLPEDAACLSTRIWLEALRPKSGGKQH